MRRAVVSLASTGLFFAMFMANRVGAYVGYQHMGQIDADTRTLLTTIVAANLGLMSLILGFAFSMAAARFDARRSHVVAEANVIGTAYLRAGLLPEPGRTELRHELTQLIDARLAFVETGGAVERATVAEGLQERAWARAQTAAESDPHSVSAGLLLHALNEMIDQETRSTQAFSNRVPRLVPGLVVAVALVGVFGMGYACGVFGVRRLVLSTLFELSISAVTFVVLDLDHPYAGLIRPGKGALLELRKRVVGLGS
jgi:hypothetical protein